MLARRVRLFVSLLALLIPLGCAAPPRAVEATPAGIPGLTEHYERVAALHHRTVRKPVRDEQARALRMLQQHADSLLTETEDWDSEARLVSLTESERPAARQAVTEFRSALAELRAAAADSDVHAVRHAYERAMVSYRKLHEMMGSVD